MTCVSPSSKEEEEEERRHSDIIIMAQQQQQQQQQGVDIAKLSLDQLNSMKQEHEQSVNELSGKFEAMKSTEARFKESRKALTILQDDCEGRPMLVPLTQSLYVPGEVADANKVLVDVGTGYYLEKSAAGAQDLIDRRLDVVVNLSQSIATVLEQKQQNLETIMMMMQYKMHQIQQRKESYDKANNDN